MQKGDKKQESVFGRANESMENLYFFFKILVTFLQPSNKEMKVDIGQRELLEH